MPKQRSSGASGDPPAAGPAATGGSDPFAAGDTPAGSEGAALPDGGDRAALIERQVRRAVHDLRQPVQAMRLFVHLLGTRLEREQDRDLVGKLDAALENVDAGLRGLMASIAVGAAPAPAEPDGEPPAKA